MYKWICSPLKKNILLNIPLNSILETFDSVGVQNILIKSLLEIDWNYNPKPYSNKFFIDSSYEIS